MSITYRKKQTNKKANKISLKTFLIEILVIFNTMGENFKHCVHKRIFFRLFLVCLLARSLLTQQELGAKHNQKF